MLAFDNLKGTESFDFAGDPVKQEQLDQGIVLTSLRLDGVAKQLSDDTYINYQRGMPREMLS